MYIQMQYCEGKTLKNFLEKPDRCVNYVENIRIFTQIVAGLHHVHSRGMVHTWDPIIIACMRACMHAHVQSHSN